MMKIAQVPVLTLIILGLSSCGGNIEPKQDSVSVSKKSSQSIASSTFSKVYKADGSKQIGRASCRERVSTPV